ncbi:hypothetical protein [Sorangium sp. So ce124]|uniref:hypothetical protein n=1 Tax=Sorangium sp. So ce124 TaxID=3133280 RepID=UPI003F5ECC53
MPATGTASSPLLGELDGSPPLNPNAEHELMTGRLTKVPVSSCADLSLMLSGAHDVMFRSVCAWKDSDEGR